MTSTVNITFSPIDNIKSFTGENKQCRRQIENVSLKVTQKDNEQQNIPQEDHNYVFY